VIALEDGERLRQAIAELPPPLMETLVMRDVNGLSYRDLAEATGALIGAKGTRPGAPERRPLVVGARVARDRFDGLNRPEPGLRRKGCK
jgi:hypothetical protein